MVLKGDFFLESLPGNIPPVGLDLDQVDVGLRVMRLLLPIIVSLLPASA